MKRTSEHQLTKDNAGAEEASSEQPQQFERAPPEVMAKRRILKARRTPNLVSPTANTGPNPFAALSKTSTTPVPAQQKSEETNVQAAEKPAEAPVQDSETKQTDEPAKHSEKSEETVTEAEKRDAEGEERVEKSGKAVEKSDEAVEKSGEATVEAPVETPVEKKEVDKLADTEEKSSEQPTTASKEAPAEIAEPAVTESAPPSGNTNDAKPSNAETDTAPGSSTSNPATSVPSNAEASDETKPSLTATDPTPALLKSSTTVNETAKPVIFGSATQPVSFASAAKADGFNFKVTQPLPKVEEKKPEFKEAKVLTGEENDKEVFRTRVKLYTLESSDGGSRWKERGVGSLKLNMNTETNKPRLLMRTEATLRVVLNTPVFKGFQIDRATDKTIRFQGFDVDDDKITTSYLARFTAKDVASEMISAIEKCKNDLE